MALLYKLQLVCLAALLLLTLEFSEAAVDVTNLKGSNLSGDALGNKPDPYVKVWCGSFFGGMTEFEENNGNPTWTAEFTFPKCVKGNLLKLEVWDKDLKDDDRLFTCTKTVSKSEDVSCSTSKGTLKYKYKLY